MNIDSMVLKLVLTELANAMNLKDPTHNVPVFLKALINGSKLWWNGSSTTAITPILNSFIIHEP